MDQFKDSSGRNPWTILEKERKKECKKTFFSWVSFRFQIAVCSSQYWYRFLGRASHSIYTLGALGKSDYWICNPPPYAVNGLSIPDRICFWPRQGYRGSSCVRRPLPNKQFLTMEKLYEIQRVIFAIFSSIMSNERDRIEREEKEKKKKKGLEHVKAFSRRRFVLTRDWNLCKN